MAAAGAGAAAISAGGQGLSSFLGGIGQGVGSTISTGPINHQIRVNMDKAQNQWMERNSKLFPQELQRIGRLGEQDRLTNRERIDRLGFQNRQTLGEQGNQTRLTNQQLLEQQLRNQMELRKDSYGQFTKSGLPSYLALLGGGFKPNLPVTSQHLGGSNYMTSDLPGNPLSSKATPDSQLLGWGQIPRSRLN